LGPFWYIFPVLVCCTEKNLATLVLKKARKNKSSLCNVLGGHFGEIK
jgi:hypothetical protein